MRILQIIAKRKKTLKAGLAALAMIFLLEDTVYAATNKSGCESKGTVTAVYDTAGTGVNGYYKKNGKVIVTYKMGNPDESCSDTSYQYVGITNKVETPKIDASEANVSGGGHVCNGHTSNSAEWKHWFGLSGSVLYGMGTKNVGSVTVTEEEYKKCSYAIAGPSSSFGDGLGSNGKFYWIVLYKKLPSAIGADNIDETPPVVELSAAPSGKTAVNPANGRTYGTQAVLTASSTDQQARPHKTKTFRFKNASGNITDWIAANSENKKAAASTYTVNANSSYYVETQDQLGNAITSKGVTVDFIDLTAPTAMLGKTVHEKVVSNGKEWTATTITLSTSASDSGAGLSAKPYCFDGVTWTEAKEYVISQNGTYQVKVQDALGNIVTKSITIDNFDRKAPEGEVNTNYENGITVGEKTWSKDGALVEAQARDEGCGLDEAPYSFDGGENWISENKHAFSENGKYEVKIRDGLHNVKTIPVEIEGIDKTAPVIEEIKMEPENWKSGNAVIKVSARDNEEGCGLAKAAYSYDGGKSWTEKNEIMLSESADLEIQVRDQLGNIANQTFCASRTPDEEEKEGSGDDDEDDDDDDEDDDDKDGDDDDKDGDDDKKKKDDKDGDDKKKKDDKDKDGDKDGNGKKKKKKGTQGEEKDNVTEIVPQENIVIPEKKESKDTEKKKDTKSDNSQAEKKKQEETSKKTYQVTLPILEEENEPIEIEEYDSNDTKTEKAEKTFWEKLCISALIAILLLGLLGLFLWYLFVFCKFRAVLYGKEEGRYKRLGTVMISKEDEQHVADIPDELLQQISGNYYRLKVNPAYLFEQEGEDIYIHIEERMLKKQVEKQIDFFAG
ncbi:MAG: hypothetical protein NC412_01670 [Roseburia sp.]|nr:hypothetical protein [Roseburia sp.]MCM1277965.1 hypothetical protein [Robinsoniella sp.]